MDLLGNSPLGFHHSQNFAPEKSPDSGPCLLPLLYCLRFLLTPGSVASATAKLAHFPSVWQMLLCTSIVCVRTKSLSHVRLFAILWVVAHQAPLSRQGY